MHTTQSRSPNCGHKISNHYILLIRPIIYAFSLLLMFMIGILSNTRVVQALDISGFGQAAHASVVVLAVTQTENAINQFAKIVLGITVPIASVGLVSFAFSFFQNERKAEEGRNRAKYCLIAVAALGLLFAAIHTGTNLAEDVSWNPNLTGNSVFIEPASVNVDLGSGGGGGTTVDDDGFGGSGGGTFDEPEGGTTVDDDGFSHSGGNF